MSLSSILKYSITDLTDYENSILGDLKGYCISKSYIWLQSLNLNENATNNPGKIMSPNPIMLKPPQGSNIRGIFSSIGIPSSPLLSPRATCTEEET